MKRYARTGSLMAFAGESTRALYPLAEREMQLSYFQPMCNKSSRVRSLDRPEKSKIDYTIRTLAYFSASF
jgi:hypothetical protein